MLCGCLGSEKVKIFALDKNIVLKYDCNNFCSQLAKDVKNIHIVVIAFNEIRADAMDKGRTHWLKAFADEKKNKFPNFSNIEKLTVDYMCQNNINLLKVVDHNP